MKSYPKYIILFYILSFLSLSNNAQTPFYTFLNGWRGAAVTEADGYIYTISNYEEINNLGNTESWLKKHQVSFSGVVINEENIRVDSSDLEGVNVLGYGAVSFENNQNWLLSNFNTYPNGNFTTIFIVSPKTLTPLINLSYYLSLELLELPKVL